MKKVVLLTVFLAASVVHAADYTIKQENKMFFAGGVVINKTTVKIGDSVHFRNSDPWVHNIFSQSKSNKFDLGVIRKGESRSFTFKKHGTVKVECSIHPDMVLVVDVKKEKLKTQ